MFAYPPWLTFSFFQIKRREREAFRYQKGKKRKGEKKKERENPPSEQPKEIRLGNYQRELVLVVVDINREFGKVEARPPPKKKKKKKKNPRVKKIMYKDFPTR
ncbi:hypothetical protein K504DRAFT_51134 [Pleomassaria siparia CBS 279.74]|uniref:Uncharacterized protein n=1 Tax=Pleomassaria siparia CBS 279.74 TaxID=1314801 RepID=A0A6G1K3P1_9PLEO|nr:hypothetical protein K504DRAFT_51134 [Pleomassaria siparia CBS 279.74]